MRGLRFSFGLLSMALGAAAYGCSASERGPSTGDGTGLEDASIGEDAPDGTGSDASVAPDADAGADAPLTDGAGDAPGDATWPSFAIGGIVEGLRGSGLVLSLGSEENLAVSVGDGGVRTFAFATKLPTGASYAVTVSSAPTGPTQSCAITSGSGVMGTRDVDQIEVLCETVPFSIGGQVVGLRGSGLVLRNNDADDLPVSSLAGADAGADAAVPPVPFQFPAKVPSGEGFDVTVFASPSGPSQTCNVAGGEGSVVAGNVSTVTVNCTTDTFTVGGEVEGLLGSGLKLTNNGGDEIAVNQNGGFSFGVPVSSGAPYEVAVSSNPTSPWQTCSIEGDSGSGTVGGGDVESVDVSCKTNEYSIGGEVAGLVGSGLELRNNGGDEIPVAQDGSFTFPQPIESGQSFTVTVSGQPAGSVCAPITGASGVVQGTDVTTVAIGCTPGVVLGGTSEEASQAVPPDTLLARAITVPGSGALFAVSAGGYWDSIGCTVKYALYTDSTGAPGVLVAETVAKVTTAGATEMVLSPEVSLAAGATYWLALLTQGACAGHYASTGGAGYVAGTGATFAGGFPASFGVAFPGGAGFDLSLFVRARP